MALRSWRRCRASACHGSANDRLAIVRLSLPRCSWRHRSVGRDLISTLHRTVLSHISLKSNNVSIVGAVNVRQSVAASGCVSRDSSLRLRRGEAGESRGTSQVEVIKHTCYYTFLSPSANIVRSSKRNHESWYHERAAKRHLRRRETDPHFGRGVWKDQKKARNRWVWEVSLARWCRKLFFRRRHLRSMMTVRVLAEKHNVEHKRASC